MLAISLPKLWIVSYLVLLCQLSSYLVATEAWQFLKPQSRSPPPSRHHDYKEQPQYGPTNCALNRRQVLQQSISSTAVAAGWISSYQVVLPPSVTNAATESITTTTDDFVSYTVDLFTFELPKSWKVIVNKKSSAATDTQPKQKKTDGKLFSAIDFATGAVVTVVEEQICSPAEYAVDIKKCDIVASTGGEAATMPFSSSSTLSKDISKLLIRHDDRDNAALQGITALESVEAADNDSRTKVSSWNVFATTNIPAGGTYKDGMGADQPNMIARRVQTKVVKEDDNPQRVVSLWLTAPTDDWGKPATGLKLRQSWKCITVL